MELRPILSAIQILLYSRIIYLLYKYDTCVIKRADNQVELQDYCNLNGKNKNMHLFYVLKLKRNTVMALMNYTDILHRTAYNILNSYTEMM